MAEKDYSATPLWRKLGIREASAIALRDAPKGFTTLLNPPAGVRFAPRPPYDVIVVFATAPATVAEAFGSLPPQVTLAGGLWIAWPKKTSAIPNQLDFDLVQGFGLEAGLVDNKICRIDDDWHAMRFVRRLRNRKA